MTSAARATINTHAEPRLANSWMNSPATPTTTEANATYPAYSQNDSVEVNVEISKAIDRYVMFENITAWVLGIISAAAFVSLWLRWFWK
jgi:ABC-type transporter MlaC component